jgi:hypothetical protein
MPLRDHFRSPLDDETSWEGLHAPLYAVACRGTRNGDAWHFEAWAHALAVGQPLPTLPLWLADDLAVPLELDASYEEACRILRIP